LSCKRVLNLNKNLEIENIQEIFEDYINPALLVIDELVKEVQNVNYKRKKPLNEKILPVKKLKKIPWTMEEDEEFLKVWEKGNTIL
jgi:hypothetical protein